MPSIPLTVILSSAALCGLLISIGLVFKDPIRARFQGIAWGGIFVTGGILLAGRLPWPMEIPLDGMIMGSAVLAAFIGLGPKQQGVRYFVRAILVLIVGGFVLWPILPTLTGQVHIRNLLAFFFLGLGVWSILERVSQQVSTPSLILLPTMTAVSLMIYLGRGDSGLLMSPLLLQAGLLVGALVAAIILPGKVSSACALPFVSVFLVVQLAAVHFYLRSNPWILVFLCAPYVVLWMRSWIPLLPRDARAEMLSLGVLAILPLAYVLYT